MAGMWNAYVKFIYIAVILPVLLWKFNSAQLCLKRLVAGKWVSAGDCQGIKTTAEMTRELKSSKWQKTNKNLTECYMGMKSGVIQDASITASSMYGSSFHDPHQARLDAQIIHGMSVGAWSAGSNTIGQWLQIDLSVVKTVAGIVTQGRPQNPQWVTTYKVSCGSKADNLSFVTKDGIELVFKGNDDMDTKVYNRFPAVMSCRYIRIYPQTFHGYMSIRVELISGDCFDSVNPFI